MVRLIYLFLLFTISCFSASGCSSGCESRAKSQPGKVVLIGIDGITFDVIEPLIAEGSLPNHQRLMQEGAWSILHSEDPTYSPALWNTIVTGVSRQEHGILAWAVPAKYGNKKVRRLYTSRDRKVPALWNYLSQAGRSVSIVGFLNTYPAEAVTGNIVSDHVGFSWWAHHLAFPTGKAANNLTYPESLYEQIKPYIVTGDKLQVTDVSDLAPLDFNEILHVLESSKPAECDDLARIKSSLLSQLTYERIGMHLLEQGQPDLFSLYLYSTDGIGHYLWHYYEPENFPEIKKQILDRRGLVIPGIYKHNDRYLGRLLESISPDSTVIIVSDHGMQASTDPCRSGMHALNGAFIAWGKNIVPSGKPLDPTIYDIAPTILALLDLSIPENMSGRVLTEIIEPGYLKEHPIRSVPAGQWAVSDEPAETPRTEKKYMDRLRSLGYVP